MYRKHETVLALQLGQWAGLVLIDFTRLTWNLYISPLRTLLSTVPPKMYMASWMTAAAWKRRPLGIWKIQRVGTHKRM